MKLRNSIKAGILSAFAVLAVSPIASVQAETTGDITAQVGIQSGQLSISSVDFGGTTVIPDIQQDGTTKTSSTNLSPLTVTDSRGTGEGYRVTVSATPMTEIGGIGLQLPSGSLSLKPVASITANGTTSPAPSIVTGDKLIDDGSSHTLISANVNEGMGSYDVTFPVDALSLTVNPDTKTTDLANYPDGRTPFSSVLTFTIVTGP